VSKSEFASRDFYDVWMPMLAPSEPLVTVGRHVASDAAWQAFVRRYRAEMKAPDASRLLDLLAALSHDSHFSVGCYCEHEQRCHRTVLRELLVERGALLAGA
jgi:uncharacterized protein YeaO (DUF488 family)